MNGKEDRVGGLLPGDLCFVCNCLFFGLLPLCGLPDGDRDVNPASGV